MKDQDTLTTHNIKNGLTVHLVIKTNAPQNTTTTSSSTNTGSTQTQRPPGNLNGFLVLFKLSLTLLITFS